MFTSTLKVLSSPVLTAIAASFLGASGSVYEDSKVNRDTPTDIIFSRGLLFGIGMLFPCMVLKSALQILQLDGFHLFEYQALLAFYNLSLATLSGYNIYKTLGLSKK